MTESGFIDPQGNPISAVQFRVDLEHLRAAHRLLSTERDTIAGLLSKLDGVFTQVPDCWQAPSYAAFQELLDTYTPVQSRLQDMFSESLMRMATAIASYEAAETANQNMLAQR